MFRFIIQIIANAFAIYLADLFIEGVGFSGDMWLLLIAGLILGILNFILKPILKIISAPLIILTLGIFTIIINIFILWLLQTLIPELSIVGFWAYIWIIIIVSVLNFIIHALTGKK
ncbi:MAG: phage holin family protein [Patescibacteria group bacterium]